jgi:DNA-binding beta-propeller fold protein YncE
MSLSRQSASRLLLVLVAAVAPVAWAWPTPVAAGQYLGPVDVVASPDQQSLYVVAADAKQIVVVNVADGKVARKIDCPQTPSGLAVNADGTKLFVTCGGPQGTVCVIEASSGKIAATIPVGHTPRAPVLLPGEKQLIVCNRFNDNVSIIDLAAGKETQRVQAIREPCNAAATPDGKLVLVTNLLPVDPADSYNVAAELTVIDMANLQTSQIRLPNGSSSVHEVCVSPDGAYAYVAHVLSRYQMPTTQLERGWMNTNALSVIDVAAKSLLNTVLLDNIDLGAANPYGVATTADGKTIIVSHRGTHELSVIDAAGLVEKLKGMPQTIEEAKQAGRYDTQGSYSSVTAEDVPNDLAFLVDLRRRVQLRRGGPWGLVKDEGPLINSPRGLDVIGTTVYVAVYFSDMLTAVDLEDKSYYPVKPLPLGPEPELTVQRRGEMYFHDADFCFQHWQSCSSCHPDARVDALNWDLMNDGLGTPKNAKSMLLAHRTPPSMSLGVRSTAEEAVRAGITHIQFAVRPEEDAVAIDEYLKALEPVPSPYLVNGQLSEAALRGKELFFNENVGCAKCHPEPLYSDMKMHNVGSKGQYDRRSEFDTPTLIEAWRTAPYMHDGHYPTMKGLLKEGQHGKFGGDVKSLSDQELDDLSEFVLSL